MRQPPRRRRRKRLLAAAACGAGAYVLLAYGLLPAFWTLVDRWEDPAISRMVTQTAEGRAGDPVNIGIVAEKNDLLLTLHAAGWFPADPITLATSVEIVGSVVLDRPFRDAPVSPLFYDGRREDAAFEKPVGESADRRQHVRLWQTPPPSGLEQPLWLGSVTYDRGVGFSHYTGAVTHDVASNVDQARDLLAADLAATGRVLRSEDIEGVGPTSTGRNGEGDRYETDGMTTIVVLKPGG